MPPRSLPLPRPRRALSERQRLAWLRLIRSENVGPVTFRELVNHYGGAEKALDALPELARRGGRGRAIRICKAGDAEAELERGRRIGSELIAVDEVGYPLLLAMIDAPPPLLHVRGRKAIADLPAVAIVGSRDASAAGRKIARTLAANLGLAGLAIVSGLARGIDASAHEAALGTGTVAVLAGGIDMPYPPENRELSERIGAEGLLVSELPPGFEPRGQDFPRRNRIISGASLGVVVVEAARRSGSRITARLALEQGREVFAVPGNPLDTRAEGTNQLLKDGATLVTTHRDVLEVLVPMLDPLRPLPVAAEGLGESERPSSPPAVDDTDRSRVLEALGAAPIEIDELARASGVAIGGVRVALIELDIAGRIERHAGQRVSRRAAE